jgi:hypothetical protein
MTGSRSSIQRRTPAGRAFSPSQGYLIDHNQGRYFLGKPELGNAADVLSLMRGMDRLAVDLIDHPEAVADAVTALSSTWVELMEQVHQINLPANDGEDVLAWVSRWAPGRHDQVASDFASVISPTQFPPSLRARHPARGQMDPRRRPAAHFLSAEAGRPAVTGRR